MKSFFEILNEAVAAKTFSQKWEKLVKGVAKHKKRRPEEVNQWTLTGHVYDYTDDAITKMKEKVFGKMGSSEMLFYTSEGILTFPAIGDVIHADLKRGALKFVPKEMTSHPNFNHESYKKLENSHIYAQGRIQHHAGGGVISLSALAGHDLKAAIRAITRAYPNYKIHDGHGREYEVNEAVAAKAKKSAAGFGAKWKKYHDSVRRAGEASGREYSSAAIYADSPWLLTGHAGIDPDGTKEIERMKAKVFGKRGKSRILFYTDKGILTFNADGAVTHSHIKAGLEEYIHTDDHADFEKLKSASEFYGEGRIDNNANGGGMISYRSHKQADLKAGIRALQKAYPKHKIHDGYGNEFGVNEAVAAKAKKSAAGFGAKWKRLQTSLKNFNPKDDSDEAIRTRAASEFPWVLTGHVGDDFTNPSIEKMKERVFGKPGSSEIFFYTKDGLITFPAKENLTHQAIRFSDKKWAEKYGIDFSEVERLKRVGHTSLGRIQHLANGKGIISLSNAGGDLKATIRALERAYPKYDIHDGYGNRLDVAESLCATERMKGFLAFIHEDIEVFPGMRNTLLKFLTLKDFREKDALPMSVIIGSNESKAKKIGSVGGFDLWVRSVDYKSGPDKREAQRHFVLVTKEGTVMLYLATMAGTAGVGKQHIDGMGEDLRVFSLTVHPRAQARVSGKSLPTLLYKFLHDKGITIQSDHTQSQGGAALWNKMRKSELGAHMSLYKGKGEEVPAAGVKDEEIWSEDPEQDADYTDGSPKKVKADRSMSGKSNRLLILRGKKK